MNTQAPLITRSLQTKDSLLCQSVVHFKDESVELVSGKLSLKRLEVNCTVTMHGDASHCTLHIDFELRNDTDLPVPMEFTLRMSNPEMMRYFTKDKLYSFHAYASTSAEHVWSCAVMGITIVNYGDAVEIKASRRGSATSEMNFHPCVCAGQTLSPVMLHSYKNERFAWFPKTPKHPWTLACLFASM